MGRWDEEKPGTSDDNPLKDSVLDPGPSGAWNTHFIEYFRKHLDDYYVCFTQRTPPPGMLSGYTTFHFPLH